MENKDYLPSTFVNVKRVKTETDAKGRERTVLTFGTYTDKNGTERNSLDELINALLTYQGKQVNLDVRVEEKTSEQGRSFPSAFVRIVEMIPKSAGQVKFVPKQPTNKAADIKARAAKIQAEFKG